MIYGELIDLFGDRPFFESDEVHILFKEPRGQIEARLSRWVSKGKLLKLRNKKYLLPERYRKTEPNPGYISNFLYRPSYVQLLSWLLFSHMYEQGSGFRIRLLGIGAFLSSFDHNGHLLRPWE